MQEPGPVGGSGVVDYPGICIDADIAIIKVAEAGWRRRMFIKTALSKSVTSMIRAGADRRGMEAHRPGGSSRKG